MGILRTNEISGLETPTAVTGSVLFDGSANTYITTPHSSEFAFGTTDFTIEWWGRYNTISSTDTVITKGWDTQYAPFLIQLNPNSLSFLSSNSGTAWNISNTVIHSNPQTGIWYHYAIVRNGSSFKSYVDGIETSSFTSSLSLLENTREVTIGSGHGGYNNSELDGYISNLRILKGTALYTSDFTPPVHELQPIGDNVLLCCNNPDSAGAEATGKEITVNGNAAASTVSPGLTRDFTFGTQFQGVAKFDTQGYFVPPSGTTEQRGRGRGIFGGGLGAPSPLNLNVIDYVSISSMGNAFDFGDLTAGRRAVAGLGNQTRGIISGGADSAIVNTIEFLTIASTGNAQTFGELTDERRGAGACASNTRGIIAGGRDNDSPSNKLNTVDYITIASLGDALSFGELNFKSVLQAGVSSPTRGVFAGGYTPTPITSIDFITIATTGNATSFGDLLTARYGLGGVASSVRGVFAGGYTPGAYTNVMDYITIASTGDAQDFGDLSASRGLVGGASNGSRGIFGGGNDPAARSNAIEYVTIASTGNAQDFGDLIEDREQLAGLSDSHGGLS